MRRGTLGGFVTGFLILTTLEAFITGPQVNNAGGMLRGIGGLARRWADPTVPAIPDLRTRSSSSTSTPSTSSGTGALPAASSARPTTRLPATLPA